MDLTYKHNARHLSAELEWFRRVVEARYRSTHGETGSGADLRPPTLNDHPSPYGRYVEGLELSTEERLVLILALAPHVQPEILDDFLEEIDPSFRNGLRDFDPTVATALFLLAGDDLEERFRCQALFAPGSRLVRSGLISVESPRETPSPLQARLRVAPDVLSHVTTGAPYQPEYGHRFPARRVATLHDWEDLVLADETRKQLDEVAAWVAHGDTMLYDWELIRRFSPGYRVLFHGPPGTGKTMTAALLGMRAGLPVYRIDLSLVVSKYIGETEKNLRAVFDTAENREWILLFDEAEALFGKRTDVQDAHDRYANQEVAYLLQRIEDYDALVILATNMRQNLDEAFTRRFQAMVHFPLPGPHERLRLWRNGFSERCALEAAVDLEEIARRFELSGGGIMNVVRYASLKALQDGGDVIRQTDILNGVRREYGKEGKSL